MAPRFGQGHVAAIGDMRSRTACVGFQIVSTNDAFFILGDENRVRWLPPIVQCGVASDVARLRIGFARSQRGFEYCPNGFVVGACRRADSNQILISAVMYKAQGPDSMVRSPASVQIRSPPRGLTCRALSVFLPRRFTQYGVSAQWAEPVTGSSGTPLSGAKKRETKS